MSMQVLGLGWVPWTKAGAYFVATLIVARVLDWLLSRHAHSLTRLLGREFTAAEASRLRLARRLLVAVVLFVGIALALMQIPQVGSLAKSMLASAGITALVVGLAARSVLANLVSGVLIAFSQPVRIGDSVTVDDVTGTVEEIRLTYTYIRTADNRRVLIPNEQLTSRVIHNYSLVDATSSACFEFEVPVGASLPRVRSIVLDLLGKAGDDPPPRPPSLEVTAVTVGAVRLRASVWAADRPTAVRLASEAQRQVAEGLQSAGLLGSAETAAT